ncbi:MAG: glucose-6-phosphate isomerase family protein [Pseudoflavonifractor sp.]
MADVKPFVLDFDLLTGFCRSEKVTPIQRRISDMASQFADEAAAAALVAAGNPLLYEFYGLDLPEEPGVLQFGTTILYPGKVGDEYFMTKGHFHTILDTSEVYYCLAGDGMMMMETPEGEVQCREVHPGDALYVPGKWAHRSINTGTEKLVMFFVYRSDAGHDYGTIEEKGYRKLMADRHGVPTLIDNPKWRTN